MCIVISFSLNNNFVSLKDSDSKFILTQDNILTIFVKTNFWNFYF